MSGPDEPADEQPVDERAAESAGDINEWLVLVYKVPSEPTRLRAAVWRRLKGLGAIYLQNSVATLPAGLSAERSLRKLRHEILEMNGSAVLFRSPMIAGGADVFAAFQAARNDEYEEIVDKCQDFLAGIDKEFTAEHFSFAELEENEVDQTKLVNWLAKVRARDVLGSAGRQAAVDALAVCERALQRYADRVYAEDPAGQ